MSSIWYILDADQQPVPASIEEWSAWYEATEGNRRVALDTIQDMRVSTVFLGINHRFSDAADKPPILWETMIFGGPLDGFGMRYTSLAQARHGHQIVVDFLRFLVTQPSEILPDYAIPWEQLTDRIDALTHGTYQKP